MKPIYLLLFTCFSLSTAAQTDTVVVKPDSSFISHFSRKLNYERHNLKYSMQERGSVRDVNIFLSTLQPLPSGTALYAVCIDTKSNRDLFTDAPRTAAEYIDADEVDTVVGYLEQMLTTIMNTDQNAQRYTEYRFYTRGGIMLECYTGINRWRFCLNYKTGSLGNSNLLQLDKLDNYTYINRTEDIRQLADTLKGISKEIKMLQLKDIKK